MLLLWPVCAGAQVVRGRVIDADTRVALSTVQITASGPGSARALTDSAGIFRLDLPGSGTYMVAAERIGYTSIAQPLPVTLSENLVIEIRLSPNAIPLQPLTVVARTSVSRSGLEGFYQRAEWSDKIGLGVILRRSDIDRRAAGRSAHLISSVPGTTVRGDTVRFGRGGRPCRPEVFVDGVRGMPGVVDVEPQSIEGIEVYRGPSQMPAEFLDRTGCGSVLIWTRRTLTEGKPISWRRVLVAGGILVGIVLLARR